MRGYRVLALLLAMALLWTATCALGEEMNIELTDEALQRDWAPGKFRLILNGKPSAVTLGIYGFWVGIKLK